MPRIHNHSGDRDMGRTQEAGEGRAANADGESLGFVDAMIYAEEGCNSIRWEA